MNTTTLLHALYAAKRAGESALIKREREMGQAFRGSWVGQDEHARQYQRKAEQALKFYDELCKRLGDPLPQEWGEEWAAPRAVREYYISYDEAFAALVGAKGNDYCGDPRRGLYFKTELDTFGDGPYYLIETANGWKIC